MIFSPVQILLTILAVTLGTMLTRFLPFLLFPNSSKTPKFIRYLGKVLPYAVMGMLVVYCCATYPLPQRLSARRKRLRWPAWRACTSGRRIRF